MSVRPNFTEAHIEGDFVHVDGASDEDSLEDILDISVTLVQDSRAASGATRVDVGSPSRLGSVWTVKLPVEDADGGADFRTGPVVAFGVEKRRENFTTTTWVETLTIS